MAKHINWTPGMDERLIVLNRERVFFRLIAGGPRGSARQRAPSRKGS